MAKFVDVEVLKKQDFQDYSKTDVEHAIDNCPSADVKEDKLGVWVFDKENDSYKCSLCNGEALCDSSGRGYVLQLLSSYCPYCGAEMEQG